MSHRPAPHPVRHRRVCPGLSRVLAAVVWACALVMPTGSPAGLSFAVASEPPPELEAYEGRLIGEIVVRRPAEPEAEEEYQSLDRSTERLVRNQLRSAEGGEYRQRTVRQDVENLNKLGRFRRVESRVELMRDGSVNLIYTVEPQPIVQDVQVVGNRRLSDQELLDRTILVGAPVDRVQLDRAARRIRERYRERGHFIAQVEWDEEELDESGIVLFRVTEGERVRVTDIRFEGNRSFSNRELRGEVETRVAGLLRRGRLDDDQLDDDVSSLIEFYRNRGYLDVRADRTYTISPDGREAIVTFVIDEGPVYTLRDVQVEYYDADGQRVEEGPYTAEQLAGLMEIKTGDVYAVNALERSIDLVRDAFGKLGYADVRLRRFELRDPELPEVDILLQVTPGQRFRTGEVLIQGNHITRHEVIRRRVRVRPDRPLDTTAIRDSERRLRGSRLFQPGSERITIQEPDPREPEYRDVLIEVDETNTGQFNIGAAVSSDGGLVGQISLQQRNFDLADTPDSIGEFFTGRAFRGGGQTFRLELMPGDRQQTYVTSISDPALFDTDYSGNIGGGYRARRFRQFREARGSFNAGIGRSFGERWVGNLSGRVESIDISGLSPDSPTDFFAIEDRNLLTGLGVSFSRTTLDDRLRPSRGTRMRFSAEQVGAMGGDFDFTKLGAEHSLYLPLTEDFLGRRTVLSFDTRANYIPQSHSRTPAYERYYMGGQNFRGFDFRAIAPVGTRADTGEPSRDTVGGNFSFFFGTQVNQPIWDDTLSIVGFIDTGTVNESFSFDNYRVSTGFGFRLYIEQLSPAPLAFDFGFPLVKEDTDRTRLFSFSVDVPF